MPPALVRRGAVGQQRHAEVGQERHAVVREQDVGRLDVAVDDVRGVRVAECGGDLAG